MGKKVKGFAFFMFLTDKVRKSLRKIQKTNEMNGLTVAYFLVIKSWSETIQYPTDWFICYFRVLGKSFRGDFWRFLR